MIPATAPKRSTMFRPGQLVRLWRMTIQNPLPKFTRCDFVQGRRLNPTIMRDCLGNHILVQQSKSLRLIDPTRRLSEFTPICVVLANRAPLCATSSGENHLFWASSTEILASEKGGMLPAASSHPDDSVFLRYNFTKHTIRLMYGA
jgi:hypothetical protein